VKLLNASVAKAIETGVFKTIETNEGLTFAPGTPEAFDRFVGEDIIHWHDVVKGANIRAQ
jgi:tripartite-type tricarboxylate transporter receptor subunit TctC